MTNKTSDIIQGLGQSLGPTAFERMKADPVLFIKAFESLTPWTYQERILRQATERVSPIGDSSTRVELINIDKLQDATIKQMSEKQQLPGPSYKYRRVIISLPRQNSKSTISAWIALHRLFCGDNQQIVSVANDTAQAGIILGDARRVIMGSDVLFSQLDDFGLQRGEIRLANGNRWLIKSSESVASRGLRPSLILYDELGWASDRMLYDTLSAGQAAQVDPQIIVTSTVGPVKDGVLWDLFELSRGGDPSTLLIYETENLSPLITPAYLESQQAQLPAHIFAREHLNLWGEGTAAVCSEADWKRAIADGDPRRIDDPGPCHAFLDLGWVHDESVLVIMRKLGSGKMGVLCMETWQGSASHPVEFGAISERLEELCGKFNVQKLVIESPQGYQMAQLLALSGVSTEILSPTAKSNQENWGALITALKNGTICLPDDARLRRQLLTLTIETTATGWKVVDVPSIHNDRAVAVAGCLAAVEKSNAVWYIA